MNYSISRMDDEGNWVALEIFETYSEAEMNLDWYSDQYPNTIVDILFSISDHTAVVLN